MRQIPTSIHGLLDYAYGLLLIAAPFFFDFRDAGVATWIPVIAGVLVVAYSLLTAYELGQVRWLSMRTHLTLDLVLGAFLALSPWLFGFAQRIWWPHLVFGLVAVLASLTTRSVAADRVAEPKEQH